MPRISVITVVYNSYETVEQTIVSVLNQNFTDFEYIMIDGQSTDGTVDIIKKYDSQIAKWVSETDSGVYDAMNKGVRMSNGKWIYFLGADDVFCSHDVLEKVALNLHTQNEIVYGNVIFKSTGKIYDGVFNTYKIVTRNIAHQSVFYPRRVFERYTFNTNYKVFADYHLNLILFGDSNNWSFKYLPYVIAIFNDRGISGSGVQDPQFENDRNLIIKNNFPVLYYLYRYLRSKLAMLKR